MATQHPSNGLLTHNACKRARLAKAQCATGTRFHNTLDEYINDPSYNTLKDIDQSHFNEGWAFSFLEYKIAKDEGLDAKQAEFAVKKYCSHHHVGPAVMMSLGIIDNPE